MLIALISCAVGLGCCYEVYICDKISSNLNLLFLSMNIHTNTSYIAKLTTKLFVQYLLHTEAKRVNTKVRRTPTCFKNAPLIVNVCLNIALEMGPKFFVQPGIIFT